MLLEESTHLLQRVVRFLLARALVQIYRVSTHRVSGLVVCSIRGPQLLRIHQVSLLSDRISLRLSHAPQSVVLAENRKPWRIWHTQLDRCVPYALVLKFDCIGELLLLSVSRIGPSGDCVRAPVCFRLLWRDLVSVVDLFANDVLDRLFVRFF